MSISSWPEGERPREKLIRHGVEALSDAELVAVFLRTGVRGKSALDVARNLLATFGGLRGLLKAESHEVCAEPGVGTAKFAQMQAALEIGRRTLAENFARESVFHSPADVYDWLALHLRDRPYEAFWCLYLDTRNRMVGVEEVFRGTIDGAAVYPREIVRRALKLGAAAIIVAHNHPSGVAEPSRADESVTRKLKAALELVDIRLLDHIIIGEGPPVSLSERGLM